MLMNFALETTCFLKRKLNFRFQMAFNLFNTLKNKFL